jgi:ribosomal protein S18 acetylase RimI-like enzyme
MRSALEEGNAMSDITVRRAMEADLEALVPAYAKAIADEATNAWITAAGPVPEEAYLAHFTEALSRHLRSDRVLVAERDGRIEGVSIWIDVDGTARFHAEADELAAMAAATPLPLLRRAEAAMRLTAQHHPGDRPHVYLYAIAVVPEHRGAGAGGAMLRAGLAEPGGPAYLEASTPDSARLYRRFGFEETGRRLRLPEAGPALIPMWRE